MHDSCIASKILEWELPARMEYLVVFIFGGILGSFINVCIYRLPRAESIIWPPSHCPHCKTQIKWYHNIPLFSWIFLKGRCAYCKKPISIRYFVVELLTSILLIGLWAKYGESSFELFIIYSGFVAILLIASFIDLEHLIIPDTITLGLVGVGLSLSLLFPQLHNTTSLTQSFPSALIGGITGVFILYIISVIGRFIFGKEHVELDAPVWLEISNGKLITGDDTIELKELLYRPTDCMEIKATKIELPDRCMWNKTIRISSQKIYLDDQETELSSLSYVKAEACHLTLPREVMGLGDVKFIGGVGTFIGWKGVLFTIGISALVGSIVGLVLIGLKKHQWSQQLPYGPYLAIGAVVWIFAGPQLVELWVHLGQRSLLNLL